MRWVQLWFVSIFLVYILYSSLLTWWCRPISLRFLVLVIILCQQLTGTLLIVLSITQSTEIASWNSITYVLLPRNQIMNTRLIWTKTVLFMAIKRWDGNRILLKQRLKVRKKLHALSRFMMRCLICMRIEEKAWIHFYATYSCIITRTRNLRENHRVSRDE